MISHFTFFLTHHLSQCHYDINEFFVIIGKKRVIVLRRIDQINSLMALSILNNIVTHLS